MRGLINSLCDIHVSDGYSICTDGGHWIYQISPGPSGGNIKIYIYIYMPSPLSLSCAFHFMRMDQMQSQKQRKRKWNDEEMH